MCVCALIICSVAWLGLLKDWPTSTCVQHIAGYQTGIVTTRATRLAWLLSHHAGLVVVTTDTRLAWLLSHQTGLVVVHQTGLVVVHHTGLVVVTTDWPGCCYTRLAWLLSHHTGLVVITSDWPGCHTTLAWLLLQQTGLVVIIPHWPGCYHIRLAWLLSTTLAWLSTTLAWLLSHHTGLVVVTPHWPGCRPPHWPGCHNRLAWLDRMSHAAWLHALWLCGCQFNPTGLFYSDFCFGVNQSLKESKFQRITHCFVTLTETRSKSLMDLFSCGKTFTCICFLLFDSG